MPYEIDPDTGDYRWFEEADAAFIRQLQTGLIEAPSAAVRPEESGSIIAEIPGGGGTYNTVTGEIISYDPVRSEPFQQPGQVYPTYQGGEVIEQATAVINGQVFKTLHEAEAFQAVTQSFLSKTPGEAISGSIIAEYRGGAATITFELRVGVAAATVDMEISGDGSYTAVVEVAAPEEPGTYGASIRVLLGQDVLASVSPTRPILVR